ncbi:MAG: hypothetical protein QOH49_3581, partial [Acidobacteriota bacterium]|nr:hypothetical protein [Acidobacteriota bacterium]
RGAPTIGRPVANTSAYVLDAWLRPVPIGVTGDLYLSGEGLARGYLNRPDLTAEKFIPDPYGADPGARMYRTGDLARYQRDGRIEFLGRADNQVKIRGFRIELGEIETVLQQHARVRDCVVVAREDSPGKRRLVGYIVGGEDGAPEVAELRRHLQDRLPDYMTPAAWVMLDALPLTPNGKVDRKALPTPERGAQASEEFTAPRTPEEVTLAEIWSQVLGVERVSINDNFFHLGGDSILSIQIIARANQAGLRLMPKQLFQHQTVAELAAAAAVVVGAAPTLAEQGLVSGLAPLTPIQQWLFEQDLIALEHFNQSVMLEVRRGVRGDLLEEVVRRLAAHHDALRLRFERRDAGLSQLFAGAEETVSFTRVDFSNLPDEEVAAAIASAAEGFQSGLHLSAGPLASAALFDLGEERPGRLLLVIHHLLVDGVSWRVLLEDLHAGYEQASRGEEIAFASKTTSFKLWAERLSEYAQSEELREELAYWLGEGREAVESLPLDFPLQ